MVMTLRAKSRYPVATGRRPVRAASLASRSDWRRDVRTKVIYSGTDLGKRMHAVFSPGEVFSNRGSDARHSLITRYLRGLSDAEQRRWVAGHLLNADFGGPGDQAKNITPLTASANHTHLHYENIVRRNQDILRHYFSNAFVIAYGTHAIRQTYTVTLSGTPGLLAGAPNWLQIDIGFETCRKSGDAWRIWTRASHWDIHSVESNNSRAIRTRRASYLPGTSLYYDLSLLQSVTHKRIPNTHS